MAMIWHGKKVSDKLHNLARTRVGQSAMIVESEAKGLMKKGGRTESGSLPKGQDTRTKINTYRSRPGEPPRVQTGTLRRSITTEMHPTMPIARAGTNLFYAKLLELGYPGGKIIRPKTAKALRWVDESGVHYAKSVRQGAIEPRPFMRPALHRAEPIIRAMWRRPPEGEVVS